MHNMPPLNMAIHFSRHRTLQRAVKYSPTVSAVKGAVAGAAKVMRWIAQSPFRIAVLTALVAILARLPLMFVDHSVTPGGDSGVYMSLAERLLDGDGFIGNFRTPGYPALIAALTRFPGDAAATVAVFQLSVGVVLAAGAAAFATIQLGRVVGLLTGFVLATSPKGPYMEHLLLPDFLFGALSLLVAALLLGATTGAEKGTRLRRLVGCGAALGGAIYLKGEGFFLLLSIPFAFVACAFINSPRERGGYVRALKDTSIVVLTAVVVIAPWFVRNSLRYDQITFSTLGNQTLFYRVFDRDRLSLPPSSPYAALIESIRQRSDSGEGVTNDEYRNEMGERLSPYEELVFEDLEEEASYSTMYQTFVALRLAGASEAEALDRQGELALAAAAGAPVEYAKGTWRALRDAFARLYEFEPYHSELSAAAGGSRMTATVPPARFLWELGGLVYRTVLFMALGGILACFLLMSESSRRRMAAAVLVSLWLAKVLGTALFHGGEWRYMSQVAPLSVLLASSGAVLLVNALNAYRSKENGDKE